MWNVRAWVSVMIGLYYAHIGLQGYTGAPESLSVLQNTDLLW